MTATITLYGKPNCSICDTVAANIRIAIKKVESEHNTKVAYTNYKVTGAADYKLLASLLYSGLKEIPALLIVSKTGAISMWNIKMPNVSTIINALIL